MTTATLPAPTRIRPHQDGDPIHLWCCDEDTAMCGEDISAEETMDDVADDELCPLCRLIDDSNLPCTIPGCTAATR